MTSTRRLEMIIGITALALLLLGVFVVLRPFLSSLMWAVVLCFSSWPLYQRIENALGGRRTLAALVMTLLIGLVLLTPFVVLGFSMADSVKDLANATRKWFQDGPPAPPGWLRQVPLVGDSIIEQWKDLASDSARLMAEAQRFVEPATAGLVTVGVKIGRGVGQLAISIFVGFFLFRNGAVVAEQFTFAAERIVGERARRLIDAAGSTVRGVVYGILGTALAQGVVAGIGFQIAGVPGALLLAFLVFCLSVVPMGPPLVWGPAAFWLFHQGFLGWAVFMVAWGVLVSSVDNIIRPLLISQETRLPFVLIFLGVLGGAMGFGFIGVFLGPTLLAVAFRLLDEWRSAHPLTHEASPESGATSPATLEPTAPPNPPVPSGPIREP